MEPKLTDLLLVRLTVELLQFCEATPDLGHDSVTLGLITRGDRRVLHHDEPASLRAIGVKLALLDLKAFFKSLESTLAESGLGKVTDIGHANLLANDEMTVGRPPLIWQTDILGEGYSKPHMSTWPSKFTVAVPLPSEPPGRFWAETGTSLIEMVATLSSMALTVTVPPPDDPQPRRLPGPS